MNIFKQYLSINIFFSYAVILKLNTFRKKTHSENKMNL